MDDDGRLLRRFAKEGSEEAFAALTKRHLGLVYAVCRRELESNEAAEDATQAVFLLLAQKAKTLRAGPSLAGWLFQTSRFVARNARTQAARRAHYEGKAAAMQSPTKDNAAWADIEPLLNQSLAALPARDREGVLLRFFQGLTFAEMGASLGLSEEAARKRVGRALEKLRRLFDREGVTLPSAVLPTLLSVHALRPVPSHLAASAAQIGFVTPPAAVTLLIQGVHHAMKIARLKLAAGSAALVLAGGVTYAVVRAAPTLPTAPKASVDAAINAAKNPWGPGGGEDAVRNTVLRGTVRQEDGTPVGGITVAAQIQNDASMKRMQAVAKKTGGATHWATRQEQEEEWNSTVSAPNGTFSLPVGAGIPYNVMVFDTSGHWVAEAIEGAVGAKNHVKKLPDLTLMKGALVVGRVTTLLGAPVPHVTVQSYGPSRPTTSAATTYAYTDLLGYYRLRVVPGESQVYVSNNTQNVHIVAEGKTETVNFTTP